MVLPKVDTNYVWRNENELYRVRWDDVSSIVGGLDPEPDMCPPRYRVDGPPTDSQFAALRDAGEVSQFRCAPPARTRSSG